MQIIEKPKCVKCEKPALVLLSKMWLCGECLNKIQEKINKAKQEMIIHGKW